VKAVTEAIFKEDCAKHGIVAWDFNDEKGPWRILYLKTRAQKKTGPDPSTGFRKTLIFNYIQEKIKQNPKRNIYKFIIPDLAQELNSLRKQNKCAHPSLNRYFTAGSIKKSYEEVKKTIKKMRQGNDYYNPKYAVKKKSKKTRKATITRKN
jgi:hypothetical protein